MTAPSTSPELMDLGRGSDGSTRLALPTHGAAVLGRDPVCDLVIADSTVSRRHARLHWDRGELWLEDLGSLGGTFVNDQRLTEPQRLRSGDRISLADRSLEYRGPEGSTTVTQELSAVAPADQPAVRYDIGRQTAGGSINNVGRDQYLSYVQRIEERRESFAREIAATRTKARVLVWLGLALTVVGFVAFGRLVLLMINSIWDLVLGGPGDLENFPPPELAELWGEQIGGVNVGLVGFAICAAGQLLLIVGIVLHIVATARRRRVDRDLRVPPPPWAPTPR